jgi:hypothetical protein
VRGLTDLPPLGSILFCTVFIVMVLSSGLKELTWVSLDRRE